MPRLVAAIATMLSLAACSTTGVPINKRQFDSIEVGKSTIAEVRRNLGPTTEMLIGNDGRVEMTWQWSESQAKAENFIPFVGLVGGGGATGSTNRVVVRFATGGIASEVLRGGSNLDISGGGIGTGYKSTGDQRGTVGDLPDAPKLPERAYQKCESDSDCGMDLICGVETNTGRRCIPRAQ